MTETEKAYLAGIIDGEGSIAFTKRNYLSVRVKMTSFETILYLKQITGIGCIYSYNPRKNLQKSHYKILYTWQVTFKQALNILETILSYLVTKKSDAIRILELDKNHKNKRLKRGFYLPA